MKTPEYSGPKQEQHESLNINVVMPATESLLKEDKSHSLWPEHIKDNTELESQAKIRRELISSINKTFMVLNKSKKEIKEVIESGELSESQAILMYENLSKFIQGEEYNSRIILYLPFEIIPPSDWRPESENLVRCIENFRNTYMSRWNELLSTHDVRTNFSDGDTHESLIDEKNIPRVSKVAHFIPVLLQKGLLSKKDIFEKLKESDDPILRESIADTFEYMSDVGILSDDDIKEMENSDDVLIRNMATILRSNKSHIDTYTVRDSKIKDGAWLNNLPAGLHQEVRERREIREQKKEILSPSRMAWEERKDHDEIIEKYGEEIAAGLSTKSLSAEDLQKFLMENPETECRLSLVLAVSKYLEGVASENINGAKNEYEKFKNLLENIWQLKQVKTDDAMESLWARLYNLNVINGLYLEKFGILVPKFDEDFKERKNQIKDEIEILQKQTEMIERKPELAESIYPISILHGSKIKGYALKDSDTDFAVFIKPGVKIEDRARIQEMILENFGNKALEFWLKEDDGKLEINNFENRDMSLGDSRLISILFEGVWCGEDKTMRELYKKLLTPYLNKENQDRAMLLEELERNALQYRLMHRRYSRFYPPEKSSLEQKANDMDMQSTFWDPGYRRLATKLFVKKVFLPKL